MVRLLALLDKLDLDQVRRTGERARSGLEALAREHREILRNVRGAGVMLAFDVIRADWCDALLDRAFRRGLILLPRRRAQRAFLSALRHRAVGHRRGAVDPAPGHRGSVRRGDAGAGTPEAPAPVKTRVGTLAIPLDTVEIVDLTPANFETAASSRSSPSSRSATAARRRDRRTRTLRRRRPLLQFPLETLEATMANPRAIGIALRDRVSGRFVAYALGSALENHDEEGVSSDPHLGENNTFYLQAMATLPTVQNAVEIENYLLDSLRERAMAAGFEFLSTLIEDRLRDTGPAWLRDAAVLERIDNYLGSGISFVVPARGSGV